MKKIIAGSALLAAICLHGCYRMPPEFWQQHTCLTAYGIWNAGQIGVTGIGYLRFERNSPQCSEGDKPSAVPGVNK